MYERTDPRYYTNPDLSKLKTIDEEDRFLLELTDEQIREMSEKLSFDLEKMRENVSKGEEWQQVLQAHLYFDHVISQMLRESLTNPGAIDLSRMGFSQKLQLVSALGLLDQHLIHPISIVNRIRNRVAHQLNFSVTRKESKLLFSSTPKYVIEGVEAKLGDASLFNLMFGILVHIEIIRQQWQFKKIKSRQANARLKVVLETTSPDYKLNR